MLSGKCSMARGLKALKLHFPFTELEETKVACTPCLSCPSAEFRPMSAMCRLIEDALSCKEAFEFLKSDHYLGRYGQKINTVSVGLGFKCKLHPREYQLQSSQDGLF